MKRRILASFLVLAMATVLFSGCKKVNDVDQRESKPAQEAQSNSGTEQNGTEQKETKKVAFVTPQRLGDEGAVDMVYRGVEAACDEAGLELHVVEAKKGEYEESMQAMISEGYTLIFALFPELLDSVKNVAAQNPDVDFIHTITATMGDNIQGICCYEQQSSYVMGCLAALMTKSNKIAYVGGVDNPDIHRYLDGYEEGVKSINPDIEIQVSWIGSFEDPATAKELALVHYQNGCDVLWGSGGKSALGLYEAVKEMGEGYYIMGCTDDYNGRLPGQVLASHVEAWDIASRDAILNWDKGKYEPGLTLMSMENGYAFCKVADDSQCEIPTEVREKIEDISQKIVNGDIVVKCMPSYEEIIANIKE